MMCRLPSNLSLSRRDGIAAVAAHSLSSVDSDRTPGAQRSSWKPPATVGELAVLLFALVVVCLTISVLAGADVFGARNEPAWGIAILVSVVICVVSACLAFVVRSRRKSVKPLQSSAAIGYAVAFVGGGLGVGFSRALRGSSFEDEASAGVAILLPILVGWLRGRSISDFRRRRAAARCE